jgi:hypothetical protein
MKNTRIIIFALIIGGLCGCRNRSAISPITTLDIEAAIENPRVTDLADISAEIEFIPLDDSNREGLVGVIENIEESETGFYIHDDWERPVKVFDKTGKFLSTRGIIGRGPNEVSEIANMAVDYQTDNLYLNGGEIAYDAVGRMFARNDSVTPATTIAYVNGQLIASRGGYNYWDRDPSSKITFLTLYSPDLKHEGVVEVFDKGPNTTLIEVEGMALPANYVYDVVSTNGESLLVKEGRSDTVFYYTDTRAMQPAYHIAMGDYALPESALDRTRDLGFTDGKYAVNDIIEGDKYVIVSIMEIAVNSPKYLIFDKDDSLSGFKAVGADVEVGMLVGGIPCWIYSVRDNRLIGWMQALDIVDNADAITNPSLKALAATLREDSNPVLVVATLKK